METRRLHCFVTLVNEQSFSRAASALFISQPSLSQQIKKLEEEIGAELVDRSVRPFGLTTIGRRVYTKALVLLEGTAELTGLAQEARDGRAGWLRLGIVPSLWQSTIPRMVRGFREASPAIDVIPHRVVSTELVSMVTDGRVDVAFLFTRPKDPVIATKVLWTEPYVVVLPTGHRLAARSSIRLEELQDEQFIMFPRSGLVENYDAVIAACFALGFSPSSHIVQGAPYASQAGLVAAGEGVALIPVSLANTQVEGVVFRPLAADGLTSMTTIAWNRQRSSRIVQNFVDYCLEGRGVSASSP